MLVESPEVYILLLGADNTASRKIKKHSKFDGCFVFFGKLGEALSFLHLAKLKLPSCKSQHPDLYT